jgi:hypothetical protein
MGFFGHNFKINTKPNNFNFDLFAIYLIYLVSKKTLTDLLF